MFTLGLHVSNLYVKDANLSDHSCVFFDLNTPLEILPVSIGSLSRIIAIDNFRALFNLHSLKLTVLM